MPGRKEYLGFEGVAGGRWDPFSIRGSWVSGARRSGVKTCRRGGEERIEVLRYAVVYRGAGYSEEVCLGG